MRADAVQQLRDVHGPDRVLELLPGLFRLPIPLPRNPLRELNAYLIRGRERSLLIDTGFRLPECRQALREYEDRTAKPIRLILSGMEGPVYIIEAARQLLPLSFGGEKLR